MQHKRTGDPAVSLSSADQTIPQHHLLKEDLLSISWIFRVIYSSFLWLSKLEIIFYFLFFSVCLVWLSRSLYISCFVSLIGGVSFQLHAVDMLK